MSEMEKPMPKIKDKIIMILAAGLLCLVSSMSLASQVRYMEDGGEATASISKKSFNRIKLDGDRIRSTKFNIGELEISKDDIIGDIYIRPTQLAQNKPINLSIITEQNFTYTLLLYPKSTPFKQVIIRNDAVVANSDLIVAKISKNSYQQQIIALIKAMRSKTKLEPYKIRRSKKYIDLGDLELKRIVTYKGQSFIGESFILKNHSKQILNLEEKMFFKNGVRAIKIEQPILLPKEVTEIFIVS
jgi:type-F conjugative transfer system secretin TraK